MKKVMLTVIGILILLFVGFFLIGIYLTGNFVDDQTNKLIDTAESRTSENFSYTELDTLPPVLKNYFEKIIDDGIDKPRFVRLKQEGKFKTSVDAGFKDLTAEQYFITDKPGFVWNGKINFGDFIWITGIDSYYDDKGSLLIKFMSAITITRETGPEIAQAQVVRWLIEALWFPTALLPDKNLKWIESDSTSATVLLKENDIEVTAVFHFNGEGLVHKITTERYMTTNAGPVLTSYTGYVSEYKKFGGILIPTYAEVEWNLDNQDFKYGKLRITEIEYDKFQRYE